MSHNYFIFPYISLVVILIQFDTLCTVITPFGHCFGNTNGFGIQLLPLKLESTDVTKTNQLLQGRVRR